MMKRKLQCAEFKPPQQRFVRVTESATSGQTAQLELTDGNQGKESDTEESLSAEIPTNAEQATLITTNRLEPNDIKYKPQDGLTCDLAKHNEPQTSQSAESPQNPPHCRLSLDETGNDMLCEGVEENTINKLVKHGHEERATSEVKSCLDAETKPQATEETESLRPPAKKRLRRRMGMCGIVDKKRFLVEEHHCRSALSLGEGKDLLKHNPEGTALVDDEGTTEHVLLQAQWVMSEGIVLTGDLNEVKDQPPAMTNDYETETVPRGDEPNHPRTGTDHSNQNMQINVLHEDQELDDDNQVCGFFNETSNCPINEELSYGSTDVTDKVCRIKGTSECPVEVPEEVSLDGTADEISEGATETCPVTEEVAFVMQCDTSVCGGSKEASAPYSSAVEEATSLGVLSDVYKESKEMAKCPDVERYSSAGAADEVVEGSKEVTEDPIAVDVEENHDPIGVNDVVYGGSKDRTEWPVVAEVTDGSSGITEEGSNKDTEGQAVEMSYGSTGNTDTTHEGSKDAKDQDVEMSYGFSSITSETYEGSKAIEDQAVEMSYGSTGSPEETCEGSKDPEGPAEEMSDGSTHITNGNFQGCKDTKDQAVEKSSTGITDEGSKEDTEIPNVEVIYGSTSITNETFEGLKDIEEQAVEMSSSGVADEGCEAPKETTKYHIYSEVNYCSGSVLDLCKGLAEVTEHPVAVFFDVNNGSICENSKEPTDPPAEVSCGSVTVSNEAGENSRHQGEAVEEVSDGTLEVSDEGSVKVSKEVEEAITALEESEMETEEPCPPSFNLAAPQPGMSTETEVALGISTVTKASFPVTCVETPTIAVPQRPGPGGEGSSAKTECFLGQNICEPLVISTVSEQLAGNPTLTPAAEFPQNHNTLPLSLCSITDSQLNSVLNTELEILPIPVGSSHQEGAIEDATELVRGLITELSSLNRTVMAAHREIELLRRGLKPPMAPIRRSFGSRNSEI